METTEVALLREMLHERMLFWGTLDPRLSAEAIAKSLQLAPTTVRGRLKNWRQQGFLLRYEVIPHPSHFGLTVAFTSVRVEDVRAKPRVLQDLRVIGEVLAVLDHVGPWLGVAIVRRDDVHQERVRKLLQRVGGVDEVEACYPLPNPPCGHEMTPLDWRIVRALRDHPLEGMAKLAQVVGVSRKTFARRYEQLVSSRAVWFVAVVDFTRWRGTIARFIITSLDPPRVRARVSEFIERRSSLVDMERLPPPADSRVVADAFLAIESAGRVEDVRRELLELDGVDEVEVLFPRAYEVLGAWADERMPRG